jgi:hypothetical protein
MNTTAELCSVAAQCVIGSEATQFHLAPSSSGEASLDVIIQDIGEGAKGDKKRRKQHRRETDTVSGDDGDINNQSGNSGMACAATVGDSGKRQARLPTDHFEKLTEETCSNHAYPVKHKLSDCNMMKNFMASGSLARGMEVNKPDNGDMMPFPREDAVMTIYDGLPSSGMHRVSNPNLRTPAHDG